MRDDGRNFIYGTRRWQQCRLAYKKSVGGLCERCLSRGIIRPGYMVHHKRYITAENVTNPDIVFNWDNLELLCRECHAAEHTKKRYTFDENGFVYTR